LHPADLQPRIWEWWEQVPPKSTNFSGVSEMQSQAEAILKSQGFTDLEKKVIECLVSKLDAEPGFSDVVPEDLSTGTGILMITLRGVLSSLKKKGVIHIDAPLGEKFTIVYLQESFWGLHPRWSK
jgi:hypothetical protein